jgi:geranyl-CoA carboxylase alpha subunit
VVLGVMTNRDALIRWLTAPEVVAGTIDTGWLERSRERWLEKPELEAKALAALTHLLAPFRLGTELLATPWMRRNSWMRHIELSGQRLDVEVEHCDPGRYRVALQEQGEDVTSSTEIEILAGALDVGGDAGAVRYRTRGIDGKLHYARNRETTWVSTPELTLLARSLSGTRAAGASDRGAVVAPMTGRLVAVEVQVGATVAVGQRLGVLEAMKLETILRSECDGRVAAVLARAGQQVAHRQVLFHIDPVVDRTPAEDPG